MGLPIKLKSQACVMLALKDPEARLSRERKDELAETLHRRCHAPSHLS